ncbi:MAG: four helix bundle protein [Phycisphaerae bacterium]|jgi:four helix bundle protein|nr:four helix bundle protein [Phycisphaerae bacterium]
MEDKDFKFDFEKLIVYQKALDFMHEIFKIYKKLPPEYKYTIGSNMVRAGASISNNIAEGSGKKSKKEKSRYYSISFDSTRECISVFNILLNEKLIDKDCYINMRFRGKEITNMLYRLIETLE